MWRHVGQHALDLVNSLRSIGRPALLIGHTVEVLPLCGEPLGGDPTSFSSSSLAVGLGRIVDGPAYHTKSLAMVPAFIPEKFSAAELRGIWKLIGVPSYAETYGAPGEAPKRPERRLAAGIDMRITSVGPAERPLGFRRRQAV